MSAEETAQLASLLRFGLFAHAAAVEFGRDPRVLSFANLTEGGRPIGTVICKDGSDRPFDLKYALDLMSNEPALRDEMDRAWCVSSLVLLGDRLLAEGYYDRAPVLEMVRHLRNGIAHGNRFTLRNPDELKRWPAHTRGAACQYPKPSEVTPDLHGTEVLFDFMGPGDVFDLLISVSTYLSEYIGSSRRESRCASSTRCRQTGMCGRLLNLKAWMRQVCDHKLVLQLIGSRTKAKGLHYRRRPCDRLANPTLPRPRPGKLG